MKIKEWNSVQKWIDNLCKKSAAEGEFYIIRSYPRKTDNIDDYFFFSEETYNLIISGFTITIHDYDGRAYTAKFFEVRENDSAISLAFDIEKFLKDKGAWEEGYEFNAKQS